MRVGGRSASRESYIGRPRTGSDNGQAGDSSSTTTPPGLPSTPSRNATRQPQASRACVNPFNIGPIILQQRLDLALEALPGRETDVLAADLAVPRNHDRHGYAEQRPVGVLDVVAIQALQYQ